MKFVYEPRLVTALHYIDYTCTVCSNTERALATESGKGVYNLPGAIQIQQAPHAIRLDQSKIA